MILTAVIKVVYNSYQAHVLTQIYIHRKVVFLLYPEIWIEINLNIIKFYNNDGKNDRPVAQHEVAINIKGIDEPNIRAGPLRLPHLDPGGTTQ